MGSARWMNPLCPAGPRSPYIILRMCSIIQNPLQLTNLSAATSAPKQPLHSTWSTAISSRRRHEAAVCARQFAHAGSRGTPSLLPYPCDVSKIDFQAKPLPVHPREAWSMFFCLSLNFPANVLPLPSASSPLLRIGLNQKRSAMEEHLASSQPEPQNIGKGRLSKLMTQGLQSKVFTNWSPIIRLQLFRHPIGVRSSLEITIAE